MANMGPTWVLSAPIGTILAIWTLISGMLPLIWHMYRPDMQCLHTKVNCGGHHWRCYLWNTEHQWAACKRPPTEWMIQSLIARFMGTTWGPPGADRTQVGPMMAPWTLLSGVFSGSVHLQLWPKNINFVADSCLNSVFSWWIRYHPQHTMSLHIQLNFHDAIII